MMKLKLDWLSTTRTDFLIIFQLTLKASTIDGRRKGACLFCQEYFMDLYLLAELKTISLKVTTVDMQVNLWRWRWLQFCIFNFNDFFRNLLQTSGPTLKRLILQSWSTEDWQSWRMTKSNAISWKAFLEDTIFSSKVRIGFYLSKKNGSA